MKKYTCQHGDIVISGGKRVSVAEIICGGSECNEEKSYISVNRIMSNGQVLKNSTICVDQNWQHPKRSIK